ncbi:hypothetical protein ACFVH0_00575 [Streptomyces sp. NPDC127117]|uniref:hypothetical protein n=1 Tax=Streptomyces sp. NPDC127117 TaxID=3345368 RepID=UPI00363DBFD0
MTEAFRAAIRSTTYPERVLLVSPEPADVLSTIIRRVRDPHDGTIPLLAADAYAKREDFLGHFERRKLSVGTCAYGTACIHEHACFSELGHFLRGTVGVVGQRSRERHTHLTPAFPLHYGSKVAME